jgi:hypothetical protein
MGLDKSWFETFESFCGGRSRILKEEKTYRVSIIKVSTRGLEGWITASGERLNRPGLAGRVSHGRRTRGRVSIITLGEAMAPIYSNSWNRISNPPCSPAPDEQVSYLSPLVKFKPTVQLGDRGPSPTMHFPMEELMPWPVVRRSFGDMFVWTVCELSALLLPYKGAMFDRQTIPQRFTSKIILLLRRSPKHTF